MYGPGLRKGTAAKSAQERQGKHYTNYKIGATTKMNLFKNGVLWYLRPTSNKKKQKFEDFKAKSKREVHW
jgi:hypothetical protein